MKKFLHVEPLSTAVSNSLVFLINYLQKNEFDKIVLSFCFLAEDGRYTLWSDWSMCSKTCGGGDKYRTRTCTNPKPKYGGRDCIKMGLGHPIEHALCNTACCPGKFMS